METTPKKTPLHSWHMAAGAKMAPFAGWDMPIQYEGIVAEHQHTRQLASIFDICHMGEFLVHGSGAASALEQAISTNLRTLAPGRCRYGFLLNGQGGIMDDLVTYRLEENSFFLVVNAACTDSDLALLRERLPVTVDLENLSDQVGKIDLQGPASVNVLESLLPEEAWRKIPFFGFVHTWFDNVKLLVSRTGYTGELGFELYIDANHCLKLWERLLADQRVKPAGLGARDTLRLEAGLPLYGHDLDPQHTPTEAGYSAMLTSEAKYVGKGKDKDIREPLVPLLIEGRRSARQGNQVLLHGKSKVVGTVTSGSFAPSLGNAVALAFIAKKYASEDTYDIQTDKALLTAKAAKLPFYSGTARIKL